VADVPSGLKFSYQTDCVPGILECSLHFVVLSCGSIMQGRTDKSRDEESLEAEITRRQLSSITYYIKNLFTCPHMRISIRVRGECRIKLALFS
jgi:hypothetical protein